jgi:DNA-binding MarR family transcriptional regulator
MKKQSPVSFDHCGNTAVRRAARQLGQLYDDVVEPSGLRSTQATLMAFVEAAESATLSDLAKQLVMDLSALGHTLKPLIREGLLKTIPDAQDRRVKRVVLTTKGATKLKEVHSLWQHANHALFATLGQSETRALVQVLDRISTPGFAREFIDNVQVARKRPTRKRAE